MLFKKVLLAFIYCCLLQQVKAQLQWPEITQHAKPWTRWWWLGSQVNKQDLTGQMTLYRQAGLGGLELTPIYGVQAEDSLYIPFLSQQWMDVFAHTLKEGKRLGLGIDLANATGWPFGGPWIGDEDACKNMQFKTYTLNAGETLQDKIEWLQEPLVKTENYKPLKIDDVLYPVSANKNLQALSIDQIKFKRSLPLQTLMAYADEGQVVELTSKVGTDGKLNWTAPNGKWTLYALFMGWHGKQVERAAPGGEGNVIDHFSSTALKHYLNKFDTAFKGVDVSYLRAFFNDSYEVDDARGQANFTPLLFDEFKQRRGYDLKHELPSLFTKNHTDKSKQVLCDYRMTIDELILEKFTSEWKQWAHGKGKLVRNQSHGSPANTLDLYSVVDIPETEGTEILRIKFASSTSHVMGKQLAAAEAATWLNEHFVSSLSDVKKALDVYFIGGVNHIVYHGTTYSPPTEPWPGRLFYAAVEFVPANPFWNNFPALNKYVARTQSFLQQGKPSSDVLLYFPIYDKYAEPGKDLLLHFDGMKPGFNGTDFEKAAQFMQEKGYAFDYISDRRIKQLQTSSNKIITGGTAYQTVLLPACKYIQLDAFKQLVELAKNGSTILAYKNLPTDIPGYGNHQSNKDAFDKLVAELHFVQSGNVQIANIGKGKFILGNTLDELLQTASIRKETMNEQGLQFNRRTNADGEEFYFIANSRNKKMEGWVTLQTKAMSAALFNPMNGQLGIAKIRMNKEGMLEVYLQLGVDESCIVQTANKVLEGSAYPYLKIAGEPIAITGKWELFFPFLERPPFKERVTLNEPTLWTDFADSNYHYYSGSAIYSIHFPKPKDTAKQYLLDLGEVYESASVFINGSRKASMIGPTFTVVINSSDLKEDNLLTIHVSNSMANRIIDLDKRNVHWKKFNNTNFPARFAQNRGTDNLFNASKWKPRPSGLKGPVTLTALQ